MLANHHALDETEIGLDSAAQHMTQHNVKLLNSCRYARWYQQNLTGDLWQIPPVPPPNPTVIKPISRLSQARNTFRLSPEVDMASPHRPCAVTLPSAAKKDARNRSHCQWPSR